MNESDLPRPPAAPAPLGLRQLADQAFKRAAGAQLVPGNRVRILKDAAENFPAWLDAIRAAERTVYFESYIIGDDAVGREFVAALAERARAGVRVRLLYDWLGTRAPRRLFAPLIEAGGAVRVFNPPPLRESRRLAHARPPQEHHRGRARRVRERPVRERAMARRIRRARSTPGATPASRSAGRPSRMSSARSARSGRFAAEARSTTRSTRRRSRSRRPATSRSASSPACPNAGGLFRLDQLIAAAAGGRLWLTDAYFVGLTPYVQALCAAAQDGVDVRLLVPGASDLPVVSRISRAGYRPLLEGGVRVFEWNGSMLHAKSAVADDRWARVGSTNLNIASWLTNYELDVAIEDERLVEDMAALYEQDLRTRPRSCSAGDIAYARRRQRMPRATRGERSRAARGGPRQAR